MKHTYNDNNNYTDEHIYNINLFKLVYALQG